MTWRVEGMFCPHCEQTILGALSGLPGLSNVRVSYRASTLSADWDRALLSEKQRNALELYCNEDLSLSEIAENTGISRQGVRDQLTHAETQLTFYEEKLGLLEKNAAVSEILSDISGRESVKTDAVLAERLSELKTVLNLE